MASVAAVHPSLTPSEIVVADRGSCFAHLALLVRGGIHAVFRIHQRQIFDFTPGRPSGRDDDGSTVGRPRSRWLRGLGVLDQLVEYRKPASRPEWMTAEEFATLPETLVVRELRDEVGRPGFRTRRVTLGKPKGSEQFEGVSLANSGQSQFGQSQRGQNNLKACPWQFHGQSQRGQDKAKGVNKAKGVRTI